MRRDHASVVAGMGTALGCLLVGGGAWLRWVKVEPGPHFDIYVPGVETGFELHDYLLLGLTGAGVAVSAVLSVRYRRDRLGGICTAATGVAVGLLTLVLAFSLVAPGDPTFSAHVLGPGASVTMLGALLLTVAGRYQFAVDGERHR